MADNGGVNTNALWQVFGAPYGLGFSSSSPNNNTVTGIVEAYDTPQYVTFTYPSGRPTLLQPGIPATFEVDMAPTDLTITPGTATVSYSLNGGAFTSAPLVDLGSNHYGVTIPGQPCFANVSYYIAVGTSAGARLDPPTTNYASHGAGRV